MYKLTILFRTPPDTDKFEDEWAHTFVPLSETMPGVLRVEVSNVEGGPDGPSEFYKIHEFYFIDQAAMERAMNSAEGTRTGHALNALAYGRFSLLFSTSFEDVVVPKLQPEEPSPTASPPEQSTMGDTPSGPAHSDGHPQR
jgi:uncharacterized protein (TIGR02118 family)